LVSPTVSPEEVREQVDALNALISMEHLSWTAGVTSVSNLSSDAYRRHLGRVPSDAVPGRKSVQKPAAPLSLPPSFDWRNNSGDWTTPVRDQLDCGSCWAFSTTSAFESYWERLKNDPGLNPDFSEQFLVSCAATSYGCSGGSNTAMDYFVDRAVQSAVGTVNEGSYAYTARDSSCSDLTGISRYSVPAGQDWYYVATGANPDSEVPTVDQIKAAIFTNGPLSSYINADSAFQHYRGGIFSTTTLFTTTNHAVLLVGWGHDEETGKDFWIAKNSWGTDWGEEGWFRIFTGSNRVGEGAAYFTMPASSPLPSVTSISPSSSVPGGPAFVLTVEGNGFFTGSVVLWDGIDRQTEYISATQIRAQVLSSDIAVAGTHTVTVVTPPPGGGSSNPLTFTVGQSENPVPSLTLINPTAATRGGSGITLRVTGNNFISGSRVRWNGVDKTTSFLSATYLQATIPAVDIVQAGTAQISVYNPAPGGGTSGALPFTVTTLDPSPPAQPVRLVMVHHSVGENWLSDENGGLGLSLMGNNYYVSDTNYGWGPESIGDLTDIGSWWDWFRSGKSPEYTSALFRETGQWSAYSRLPEAPSGENEVVLFKSCFPNSALSGSPSDPVPPIGNNPLRGQSSSSEFHTIANAKGIYVDILEYFRTRQDRLFVVVTAPPLSDPAYAANARAFNTWLVNDWLANYQYKNVAVFDFYNVLTSNGGSSFINDLNQETGNHHRYWNGVVQHKTDGGGNTLAYPSGDDHPTQAGNRKATGEFTQLLNIAYHAWKTQQPAPAPTVTSITPTSGQTGAVVVISNIAGTNYTSPMTVLLTKSGSPDIVATSVVVASSTRISCQFDLTGAAVGRWDVVVRNPDSQEGRGVGLFSVTSAPVPAPTVTSITPASGQTGAVVVISDLAGTNYTSPMTVLLTKSGSPDIVATSVVVASSTRISCQFDFIGAAVGTWDVVVRNSDGQEGLGAGLFSVTSAPVPAPTVSSIMPSTGQTGTVVIVSDLAGRNFISPVTVRLTRSGSSDIAATSVVVASSTRISCQFDLTGAAVGTWDVVVRNPDGQEGRGTGLFYVAGTPGTMRADFTASPRSGPAPLKVQFTDASSGSITSWWWSFGDGTISSDQNPTHTYLREGTYTVSLKIAGSGGTYRKSASRYIIVGGDPVPPVAEFSGSPRSGTAPLDVQFSDLSTGAPTSWSWDFGDGATSLEQNPLHRYMGAGTYTVTLSVRTAAGSSTKIRDSYITVLDLPPGPPVADFSGSPRSGTVPLNVQFSDLSTGSPERWEWNFGDGTSNGTSPSPMHSYGTTGTFTVSLTVWNGGGSATMVRVGYITASSIPPTPGTLRADFSGTPRSGPSPLSVAFTDLSTGYPMTWYWTFGDGGTSRERNPVYEYSRAGTYSVSLRVSNLNGSYRKTMGGYVVVG
jgi:PKD repeat protein/C1A family cysteine protease